MDELKKLRSELVKSRFEQSALRSKIAEAQFQRDSYQNQLHKTKRVYRLIVLGFSAVLIITLIHVSKINHENTDLNQQISDLNQSDLQFRFDNVLEALHDTNHRELELRDANSRLMGQCKPCNVKKAIKTTKLPDLVRGV